MADSNLPLYIGVFIGPFVQEDAAVLTAASLSTNEMAKPVPLFLTILIGLFLSDIWKYWIGWAAVRNQKAQNFVDRRKHIALMKEKVRSHTIPTLFAARFLPLARIPAYVACGLFGVNYLKFCAIIFTTALVYVSVIFAMCHVLGEIVGENDKWMVPVIGAGILLIYLGYIFWKRDPKKTDALE